MDTSAGELLARFSEAFPNWPEDSLSRRIDPIGSGSSWEIREIGTFQVIRKHPTNAVPTFLEKYWTESGNRVAGNAALQNLFKLLNQDWRSMNHEQIQKAAGPFAGFLSALSQVMEEPSTADSDRVMRERVQSGLDDPESDPNISASSSFDSQEAPPPLSSSPPEYPSKRFRSSRSAESYVPSDPETDQSIHDQRAKSEFATNFCVYELLRCVTELSRKTIDSSHRVEWSIVPNTFVVTAGQHQFSSTNDGGLMEKTTRSGQWQRVSDICYCSVEAKSWYNASGKPEKVKAQEAAHLIGMFSQRIQSQDQHEQDILLPLLSVSQNLFSLVFGRFPQEYQNYLRDGSQSEGNSFVMVEEFGVFRMQNATDLGKICVVIIALTLQSQDLLERRRLS